jgi:hypothetical protein
MGETKYKTEIVVDNCVNGFRERFIILWGISPQSCIGGDSTQITLSALRGPKGDVPTVPTVDHPLFRCSVFSSQLWLA